MNIIKNRSTFRVLFLLMLTLLHYSCVNKSESIIAPAENNNLIVNPSFEQDGDSSLVGWYAEIPSTVNFTKDTPPNGGDWAITIDVLWGTGNNVISTISIPSGTNVYKFSLWSKYFVKPGYSNLSLVSADSIYIIDNIQISNKDWTKYSVIDTITSNPGDSLRVTLSGGFSNLVPGNTFFDLCSLERLE